jgi:hypothetical protein
MDGNFVSKSTIPDVSPQETFSCSLGVDSSVKITYHPERKVVRTSGSGFMSRGTKNEVTSVSQRISVKNKRRGKIPRLVIKDQVPLSEDARIKVTVQQPPEKVLGSSGSASSQLQGRDGNGSSTDATRRQSLVGEVQKGLIARWAQKKEENGGSGGPKGDGVIEWVCTDLEDSLDVELAYEVSAPHDLRWA